MKPAALNSINMCDICHFLLSEARYDRYVPLVPFALSGKTAFCCMATFAKEHLKVQFRDHSKWICFKKSAFSPVGDRTFFHFCQRFLAEAAIHLHNPRDYVVTNIVAWLEGMTNLDHLWLEIFTTPTMPDSDSKLDAFNALLTANTRFSNLEVFGIFINSIERSSTAIHFPNLTALTIWNSLSKIEPYKFTRSTYPVLESLSFHGTYLSKDGIRKLANLCNVMRRTLRSVNVFVVRWRRQTTEKNLIFLNLICDHFKKLNFENEFTLQIHVPVVQIDVTAIVNAGFLLNEKGWSITKQYGDVEIIYDVFVK